MEIFQLSCCPHWLWWRISRVVYTSLCVCRVVLAGVCEAGSWSAICHRILSRCPDTDRSSAGLWGQQRGPPLQDSRSFLSTNSAPRCSAERHASDRPTFLCDCRSVSLKLGGQLSKMITLCIKYAAVSNFSFFSSCLLQPSFSVLLLSNRSDGRRTSRLENLLDFYTHGGGMYTLICTFLFFLATYAFVFSSSSHVYCKGTLNGIKGSAEVEKDGNCREC